jgi:hypothetical protein
VKKTEALESWARPIPLSLLLMVALAVHLPLLLMKLPLQSYDTNFHIFFSSHYLHHWFDPWNTKWFAGFSQATYPPMPHYWIAVLSPILGLDLAYMAVQMIAILLLVVGVYRFSLLWVSPRAASIAALASVFLGSESFLVYNAGQLPTTMAAPLYLIALPFLYEWLRHGHARAFIKAAVLFIAAAAGHHLTLLFGSFIFALPVVGLALLKDRNGERTSARMIVARTIGIVFVVSVVVGIVLLPFWLSLLHHPIDQTTIPHASRANFILSPQWGLNYFILPYGALFLAIPFILIRGSSEVRLRPLLIGFWVTFLLGLGGTTPLGHWLLGHAFEVLTMERFSYWAGLLALPFVGLLSVKLIDRFRYWAVGSLAVLAVWTCAMGVAWGTYRITNARDVNVNVVADWLNRGGHDQYRYFTLGFGNSISRLAVMTDASSVDGEWYTGRLLPELTRYGGASLTQAKYFGTAGLESLRAIMMHSDKYGLKWIFSNDPYYDPLLSFAGWRPVDYLDDKTITVWAKDGVPPATPVNVAQKPPRWQGLIWGTLPIGSSILAILVFMIPERRRKEIDSEYVVAEDELGTQRVAS